MEYTSDYDYDYEHEQEQERTASSPSWAIRQAMLYNRMRIPWATYAKERLMKYSALSIMLVLAWGAAAQEAALERPPEQAIMHPANNLALSAPYTMDPAPSYKQCSDPADVRQLTDGVCTQGYFWVQKSTVGWQNAKPVIVTIDLGGDKPIRGVSYRTAAGTAGVEWPSAILVFVGGEDKQFHALGDLVALSAKHGLPSAQGYATHQYWTDALQTHGRYVALAVWDPPYTFVDEIEIFEGGPECLQAALPGEPIADIKAFGAMIEVHQGVARRLRDDLKVLRESIASRDVPDAARQGLFDEAGKLEKEARDLPIESDAGFRAVLPLNSVHARLFGELAAVWRAKGYAPVTVWQSPLWDPISHMADPPQQTQPEVRVAIMANEFRAGAFNVSNATEQPLTMDLRIEGIPGGVNPKYVTVHEVAWTDTQTGKPVAAALPEAGRKDDGFTISIPSGMTRQVWLTFHPIDVEPGEYRGTIHVQGAPGSFEVPLSLKIVPLRFPDRPRLHFGGWDYTDAPSMYGTTPENRAKLVAMLRDHFVDSPWGTSAALPHGKHNASGAMTEPPDTARFDAWLELWPGASRYCVFAAVHDRFEQLAMGTPEFERAVKDWATFWAEHAKAKGLNPDQIALLLVDEPHEVKQDAVIIAWAKALHAAGTGMRVWEDPTYKDMSESDPAMATECDVLCPNRVIFLSAPDAYRDFYKDQQRRGAALEFYSCSGPVRLLDPYVYHRLQAWVCWRYGAEATYFWAFGDTGGGVSWNEYAQKGTSYTPLFLDATTVTSGKHLEACREGIEDYECLAMLRDAIDVAPAKGVPTEAVEAAKKALDEWTEKVGDAGKSLLYRWHADGVDRTLADTAREDILNHLVALQGDFKR